MAGVGHQVAGGVDQNKLLCHIKEEAGKQKHDRENPALLFDNKTNPTSLLGQVSGPLLRVQEELIGAVFELERDPTQPAGADHLEE